MNEQLFIDVRFARKQVERKQLEAVTDEDLKKINNLNRNGPLRELKKEDVNTRSIIILGEEPTTKLSIHPEGDINGKPIKSLSQISKLLPGSPMMIGHRMDKEPWGRTFDAEVLAKGAIKGYTGACLHEKYWFLADEEGNGIARKIDAGIWAEGSISYWFKEARCSICHKPMIRGWFGSESGCAHKLGEKDAETGQVCYWYPYQVQKVAETSYVFAGAYQKTRSMLNADDSLLKEYYSNHEIEAGKQLEETLVEYGLNPDDMIIDTNVINSNNNEGDNDATENTERPNNALKLAISSETGKPGTEPGSEESGNSESNSGQESSQSTDVSGENTSTDAQSTKGESEGNSEGTEGTEGTETNSQTKNPNPQGEVNAEEKAGEDKGDSSGNSEGTDDKGGSADSANRAGTTADNDVNNNADNKNEDTQSCTDINNDDDGKNGDSSSKTQEYCNNAIQNDGSEKQDSVCLGTGSSATVSFSGSLTEIQISAITEIFDDAELEDDEKETAVKEYLNGDTELVSEVLAVWSDLRLAIEGREKLRICPICKNDESEGLNCAECGSELEDSIQFACQLFKPVGPIEPKKAGGVNNEFFKMEAFRDLPSGEYFVEPNYDGVWMEIHRRGDQVKIYNRKGVEYSEKFPGIVNEVKGLDADNFILVGQMTRWRGRKRLTHQDAISWIQEKQDSYDDKEFKYKPFDIVMKSGKDVSSETLKDRRSILDASVKWGKQIQPTAIAHVKHEKGGGKIVSAIEDRKTREGAMVKDVTGRYGLKGQCKLYGWEQQLKIACRVTKVNPKEEGGFIYECEVGRGNDAQEIGKTFATKLSAKVGDVIVASVDSIRFDPDTNKFSWFTPRVISLSEDKTIADPISTVKRIAEIKKSENRTENIITLTEVIPKLKRGDIKFELFLVGAVVENGLTTHNIDILVKRELSEEETDSIMSALGERISPYTNITVDSNGPSGPCVPVIADMAQKDGKWKFSDRFVLQRHGWGKSEHWDLRLGAQRTPKMEGYTCFTRPTAEAGGAKTRCQEKKYHDPMWLSVDDKTIPPGNPGNPTKNLNAHMVIEDEGDYKFVRKTPVFLEVELNGEKYKGRYVFRQISVKKAEKSHSQNKIEGDEVGTRDDKTWIMWKPKDQTVKSPVKKIAFKITNGSLMIWESDELDNEVEV